MSTRSGRVRQSVIDSSPSRSSRKGQSPSRSPGRPRKSSPARKTSPGRVRKSPSRKSPSRKTSQPARKSPSRSSKDAPQIAIPKSPAKRPILGNVEIKLEDLSSKIESFRSVRTRRSEYSIKDVSSGPQTNLPTIERYNGVGSISAGDIHGLRNRKPIEEVVPRRSSRLREFIDNVPDIRRSFSKSISKSVDKSLSKSISKSIDTYSDEDNSADEFNEDNLRSHTRKLATPLRDSFTKIVKTNGEWEFGGRIGAALLITLIPLTVFSILLSCTKSCSISNLSNITVLQKPAFWFSLEATAIVLTQFILQATISLLPIFGTKIDHKETGAQYFFNAFFASIITVILVFALDFLKIFDSVTILNQYLKLSLAFYLFSVFLSIVLFLKSGKVDENNVNPYGNTGYKLYDFCLGRELMPTSKNLNFKIWISRVSSITTLVLTVLYFKQGFIYPTQSNEDLTLENLKDFIGKVEYKPTLLVISFLQIVYILSFIIKEYRMTTTFYWQSEGLGYLQLASSALYPFYFASVSKFVAETSLEIPRNILLVAVFIFLIGFIIMSLSNNIKYEFRKNPLLPNLSHLESMPTFHGKKLLVSHLWGVLRHPNYAGDILIHISLAIPGIVSRQYIASSPALLTVGILLHRAWRDHAWCSRRYGAAWQRYCQRVPSVIIPKVI